MGDTAGIPRTVPNSINNNKQNNIKRDEETNQAQIGPGGLFRLVHDQKLAL
jgi:hypothetical protein